MRRINSFFFFILVVFFSLPTSTSAQQISVGMTWWQQSITGDTSAIWNIQAFRLLKGGFVDTFERSHNLDSVRKYMPVKSDSVVIAIKNKVLKGGVKLNHFRIWRDDSLFLPWQEIDTSENKKLFEDLYVLLKDNSRNHRYVVEASDSTGRPQLRLVLIGQSAIRIWGIYRNVQIPKVKEVLGTVGNISARTVSSFPQSDCSPGFTLGGVDTFVVNKIKYPFPHSITLQPCDSVLFLMGALRDSEYYEFGLDQPGIFDTSINWTANSRGSSLIVLKGLKPGSHEVFIRYAKEPFSRIVYRFTVLDTRRWYQREWFYWVCGALASGLSFLLLFIAYRRAQRRAAKQREEKLKITSLQLQVYRSQLNPHFIFNALSSIQSLVNKNDNTQANQYLTDFSSLLRMTLDQQKAEFWTLQEEAELLQKYIGLEQLRFRFQYEIAMDNNLALGDISFPSMLLQPVVENAIKHGISGNYENGKLVISFIAKGSDLEITVTDNGQGFDATQPVAERHGISLTKERIAFLNELSKTQRVSMDIKSSSTGTVVRFYFQHFLNS